MIKRLVGWVRNTSLNLKIAVLVLMVGVLPLGVAFMVSLTEMGKISQEQQIYTVNQGFIQVFQAVEDKLDRVRNISTLLAVDDVISQNLIQAGQSRQMAGQLACFDAISSYINSMEMVFEANSIVFYVDSGLVVAADQVGRFRSIDTIAQEDWFGVLSFRSRNELLS